MAGAAATVRSAVRAAPVLAERVMAAAAAPSTVGATRFGSTSVPAKLPGYNATSLQEVYGQDSFNRNAMQKYLSGSTFAKVVDCIDNRRPMSPALADEFAAGLLTWAEERGATHFTHWFQPLTNYFALKHDSFIKRDGDNIITKLTGKMLVKGEPDGSSFPNGGLRDTHEARGYTVWDPSSPCFITNHGNGTTLNIPSVFFSWKGHALDEKTPLLRSVEALDREAVSLLKALGESSHKAVHADSGVEQEFFLIDKDYYLARPDLMQTGRTLIGAVPPKGQSLDDQYFGSFSDRFLAALNDAEIAMWKLGIPQTTRHREVAPGQYEMAPVFSPVNVAGDWNLLQMDVLTKVCEAHDIAVLFHEKPFANLNGSGKHNNWSIGTNKVGTLFQPGPKPEENLLFLTFLAATVRAVHVHGDVLRTAVGGAGNDWRLGANEAPPAIMSVFLGSDITDAVHRFLGRDVPTRDLPSGDLGTTVLPEFGIDSTDRNRTSPFAFTGNKFEFRAVGSSHNPTRSNIFLNTAVADAVKYLNDQLASRVSAGDNKSTVQEAFKQVLRETFEQHEAALFDGDNYSQEWEDEAERRGLLNLRTTTAAIDHFDSEKNYDLFSKHGVLSKEELSARVAVMREEYVTKILTEAQGMRDLVQTSVLPASYDIQTRVAGAVVAAESAGVTENDGQRAYLNKVASTIGNLNTALAALQDAVDSRPHDLEEEARYCNDVVVPAMAAVREQADAMEVMCDSNSYTLPTYHEMLFHQS